MKLWTTYAWKDNEEGNFDYLMQELNNFGIPTEYDKIAIVPGQRLWTQIADKINSPETTGWAYLITPNSLASEPCLEELYYALNRALETKSKNFPIIGLVTNGVSFNDVPTALKIRLCVSLTSPNWKEQIKAGLLMQPTKKIDTQQMNFIYNVSQDFNGTGITTTIEIRPRFNELHFWRIAVPATSNILNFGVGPANSKQISGMLEMVVDGFQGQLNGVDCKVVGAGSKLTPGTSAYIFIDNEVPDFVAFGLASEPFGMPTQMEIQKIK
jgi:hypothetical protein